MLWIFNLPRFQVGQHQRGKRYASHSYFQQSFTSHNSRLESRAYFIASVSIKISGRSAWGQNRNHHRSMQNVFPLPSHILSTSCARDEPVSGIFELQSREMPWSWACNLKFEAEARLLQRYHPKHLHWKVIVLK